MVAEHDDRPKEFLLSQASRHFWTVKILGKKMVCNFLSVNVLAFLQFKRQNLMFTGLECRECVTS